MGIKQSTNQAILQAGKAEFLAYGYERASLRIIASRAGVTTGAIYGYYPDKAALFDALVAEPAETLYQNYLTLAKEFAQLDFQQQCRAMLNMGSDGLSQWVDLIYDNFDAFRLVFSCAAGTRWEGYLDSLAQIEAESTISFIETGQAKEPDSRHISRNLVHMLCNSLVVAISELVVHEMPREEAQENIGLLAEFFQAGWIKLLDFNDLKVAMEQLKLHSE